MANTFILTSSAYSGRYMQLECVQTPNIAGNYSDIAWSLHVLGGSSNYYTTGPTEVLIAGTPVYQCGRVSYSQKTFPAAKGTTGGTIRVHHNDADGKCSVAVSLSTAIYTAEVSTAAGAWELDAIARASGISVTDANIESAATVVISRKNSAFTHSIAYGFGNLRGYLDSSGKPVADEVKFTKTTLNFTFPESFYSQIPNNRIGVGNLTCRTYSGNTLIGTKTCSFTATAAESRCAPLLEGGVEDVKTASLALTGDKNKLIRYVSTARCYISATAQKSATIVQRKVHGVSISGQWRDFAKAEQSVYRISAKDSRGYQVQKDIRCTLIPYVLLTANVSLSRPEPTGSNVRVKVRGNCYKGSFGARNNTLQIQCRVGETVLTADPQWNEDHSYSAEVMLTDLEYTQTHSVEVTVTDAVTAVTKNVTVKPGLPVFDWGKNDFSFHVPVTAPNVKAPVNGIFMDAVHLVQSQSRLMFRSNCGSAEGTTHQSVLLFGNRNGTLILGVIGITGEDQAYWSGNQDVTVSSSGGVVTVELGKAAYDCFTLISAEHFYDLQAG